MNRGSGQKCRRQLPIINFDLAAGVFFGFGVLLVLAGSLLPGCARSPQPAEGPDMGVVGDLVGRAEEVVRQGLGDQNPLMRVNAIEVVASTGQVKMMPKVRRMLGDGSVRVRFAAALAVGELRYALARDEVAALLNDPDQNVRVAAAYATYSLGDATSLGILSKAIASSDQTVRANATLVLGKTRDKNALRMLYVALNMRDSDDRVRYQAVESIAKLGDETIYQRIWTMLISAYADVRIMGVRAMGALATIRARDSLVNMLDDDVPEVRLAVAEQLGKLGDKSGEGVVLDVFRRNLTATMVPEARERVGVLAALAVGQICTDNLRKFLPKLLTSPSQPIRLAAAKGVFDCVAQQRRNIKYPQ